MDKDPWNENVEKLAAWRAMHPNTWPSTTSKDPAERKNASWLSNQSYPSRWPSQSAQEQAERKVGSWLSDQVKYKNRMERGSGPLKGMTPERIAILDKECPGWSSRT